MVRKVKRVNIYAKTVFLGEKEYFVESWDGNNWQIEVNHDNKLGFNSYSSIAEKIINLFPDLKGYNRIIFEKPQDLREGTQSGIVFGNGDKPYLIDAPTADERSNIFVEVAREYEKRKSGLEKLV